MAPVPTQVVSSDILEATRTRRRIVVVGHGMVGIAFTEKVLKYDLEGGRDDWEVIIVGEEPHLAYNRVGLTGYFTNRSVDGLLLQPSEWYDSHAMGKLRYHTGVRALLVDAPRRRVELSNGHTISYDACVLATGSDAALPPYMSIERMRVTQGAFVYRNIADLESMIRYAQTHAPIKHAAVVGGGLLGLEAAKALLDLQGVEQVMLMERNRWPLSRQLDQEGGTIVLAKVRELGVDVHLQARVRNLTFTPTGVAGEEDKLTSMQLDDGSELSLDMIVFAVGIKPRDDIARQSGLNVAPRGGIAVDAQLRTSSRDVYAIGECASWNNETWGLIAPGIAMADVLAFNLTEGPVHKMRSMTYPNLSTKLKLMGVDVASFGDYFADQGRFTRMYPGLERRRSEETPVRPQVKALTYRDPFNDVYKKYIFTADGKYLVGGMMVGDVSDYVKLQGLSAKLRPLEVPPSELMMGAKRDGENQGADLANDDLVCSCHNVTKGAIVSAVGKGCRSLGELKSTTKVGTGCGGCVPLATSIFNTALKAAGEEISNSLCPHFGYTRQELFTIIKFRRLPEFNAVMKAVGKKPDSLGCEVCRPAVGSIISSLYNPFIMHPAVRQTQDTNDRYLGNIQRDGTYSVVPRVSAGEITPAKLIVLGQVAGKYSLYTKITGGQRVDLFGAQKQDLPQIWEELLAAGFESGHAYGKSLRTVKSCVGSTWCRYGVGDSVGLAVELEERYKSIRAPHKIKGGVSGCIRECAEAQSKDFGLIATPKGWNIYLGGNGGAKPRHAELIAENVTRHMAVKIVDRFISYYIRSADKLQRTARWVESMPKGLASLKEVIVEDKLGICAELEHEMAALVGTFHDEWAEVLRDPQRRKDFRQFANTPETQSTSEWVEQRGQTRPADSPADSPLKFRRCDVLASAVWSWRPVLPLPELNPQNNAPTSVVVKYGDVQIAIWSIPGRGLAAAQNMCPHKRAFVLADGLLGEDDKGRAYVSCPMHKRNYVLASHHYSPKAGDISHGEEEDEKELGKCSDADYSIMTFDVRERDGIVELRLPPTDALDAVLSTTKWMIRRARDESDALARAAGGEGSGVEITDFVNALPARSDASGTGTRSRAPVASCSDKAALDW